MYLETNTMKYLGNGFINLKAWIKKLFIYRIHSGFQQIYLPILTCANYSPKFKAYSFDNNMHDTIKAN